MGCYLFHNTSVYYAASERTGQMPVEAFAASSMTRDRQAHVLMVEAEGPQLDEDLRRVRRIFSSGAIRTLVPYVTALRAFLQGRGMLSPGEPGIVVDDVGDRVLVTALGVQTGFTRSIAPGDPQKIMEEVRRTHKALMERGFLSTRTGLLRLFSNCPGLDGAVLFETRFPAFEVLGRVKFPSQLMSPEEFARMKRAGMRRGVWMFFLIAVLLGSAGTAFWVYGTGQEKTQKERLLQVVAQRSELREELDRVGALTYQTRLKMLPQISLVEVMDGFLGDLPPESNVVSVVFEREKDARWRFSGTLVFLRQEIQPFQGRGLLREALVRDTFVQGRPALNVGVVMNEATTGRGE